MSRADEPELAQNAESVRLRRRFGRALGYLIPEPVVRWLVRRNIPAVTQIAEEAFTEAGLTEDEKRTIRSEWGMRTDG